MPEKTIDPTLRGRELRHAILAKIVAEYDAAEESGDYPCEEQRVGTWDQSVWGRVYGHHVLDGQVEIEDTVINHTPVTVGTFATPDGNEPCGTAMCFAGHTALAVGDKMILSFGYNPLSDQYTLRLDRGRLTSESTLHIDKVVTDEGRVESVRNRAQELLGLSWSEAEVLFHADNTLDDLIEINDRLDRGLSIEKCVDCDEWETDCFCEPECDGCGYDESECTCCHACGRDTELGSDYGGCYCNDEDEDDL